MTLQQRWLLPLTVGCLFLLTSYAPGRTADAPATPTPPQVQPEQPKPPKPARRRKRIAVVNFEIPPSVYHGWGDGGGAAADRLGVVLSDMLITGLVKSGAFDVIERTELQKVLDEQHLSAQGLLDPATAPKAAKILGVDMVLGGKITEFGVKKKGGGGLGILTGGLLGVDIEQSTARVVIDTRMIDTTTAKIILAEQGVGENSQSKFGFAGSDFARFLVAVNFESSEWTESRLGRATRTAVDEVLGKVVGLFPVEANVRAILPDGALILDLGRFSGLKVGDKLDLVRVTLVKDEDTGEVIFEDRKPLGTVQVVEVQDNSSKCTVVGTAAQPPQKGDCAILKPTTPPKDPKKK